MVFPWLQNFYIDWIKLCICCVTITIVLSFFTLSNTLFMYIVIIWLLGSCYLFVYCRTLRFELNADYILLKKGVFFQRQIYIRSYNVQMTSLTIDWVSRLFELSRMTLITPNIKVSIGYLPSQTIRTIQSELSLNTAITTDPLT